MVHLNLLLLLNEVCSRTSDIATAAVHDNLVDLSLVRMVFRSSLDHSRIGVFSAGRLCRLVLHFVLRRSLAV